MVSGLAGFPLYNVQSFILIPPFSTDAGSPGTPRETPPSHLMIRSMISSSDATGPAGFTGALGAVGAAGGPDGAVTGGVTRTDFARSSSIFAISKRIRLAWLYSSYMAGALRYRA